MTNFEHLIVYELGPIDWWNGLIDLQKFSAQLFGELEDYSSNISTLSSNARFKLYVDSMLKRSEDLAFALGWEGDRREGPFLSAIPNADGSDTSLILAWKQNNDGTTFVASELSLPHLERDGFASAVFVQGEPQVR